MLQRPLHSPRRGELYRRRLKGPAQSADTDRMAEQGVNHGGTSTVGFLGLEQKYMAAIIITVVLAVAIVGAAYIMRPRPAPVTVVEPISAEVACLQGGGEWQGARDGCTHYRWGDW